jgi:hypothetical protein
VRSSSSAARLASPRHDARARCGLWNCALVPSLLKVLLFGRITTQVISLSAVSGFSGSWAATNSGVGSAPRLIRPALYKQA